VNEDFKCHYSKAHPNKVSRGTTYEYTTDFTASEEQSPPGSQKMPNSGDWLQLIGSDSPTS